MNLTPSSEQSLIIESAISFLEETSNMVAVRKASEEGDGFDRDAWGQIHELGWCQLLLPESIDGLGLGQIEITLLQEKLGEYLSCTPFFDSAVLSTNTLLNIANSSEANHATTTLAALAQEQLIVSAAFHSSSIKNPGKVTRVSDGWVLNGTWSHIGSLPFAHKVLLPAKNESGEYFLFLVDLQTPGCTIEQHLPIDLTLLAKNVALPESACLAQSKDKDYLLKSLCLATIGLAAEQVGVAQKAFNLTLNYANERAQFGKTIAHFQAVKHRCAEMLVHVESSRSAVYGAACMADTHPSINTLVFYAAQAFVEATKAALFCTEESIQLHGGMGFTWEFDLHRLLKRAQHNSQRLQTISWWQEQVATLLLDQEK
jgi:alkylation response protein AidB-like acyl-CoA dehydrogenase